MVDGEANEQMARLTSLAKNKQLFLQFVYNITCVMYSKVAIKHEAT